MTAAKTVEAGVAAKVLRSLLAKRRPTFVAGDCGVTVETVQAIADRYEFADTDNEPIAWAALHDLERFNRSDNSGHLIVLTDQVAELESVPGPVRTFEDIQSGPPPVVEVAEIVCDWERPTSVPDPGKPFIKAIPANLLFVDPSYQRPKDEPRVRRMVTDFDETQLGVLEVSERAPDESYAIVEGQHRWHAASEALGPNTPLVCKVHRGLTVAQEAGLFFQIDRNRKALNHWDKWKSRLASGDPTVVAIDRSARNHGYKVDPTAADGNIGAIAALERITALGDLDLLNRTLDTVNGAYGFARDGVAAAILLGVALVLANYDRNVEYSDDTLMGALQDIAPRSLISRANALREAQRAEIPRLVASVIVERYNARPGARLQPLLVRLPTQSKIFGPQGRKTAEVARIKRWASRNDLPNGGTTSQIPKSTIDGYLAAIASGVTPR